MAVTTETSAVSTADRVCRMRNPTRLDNPTAGSGRRSSHVDGNATLLSVTSQAWRVTGSSPVGEAGC